MKNKIVLVVMVSLVLVALVGCQQNDYQSYIEAQKKTQAILQGKKEQEIRMNLKFDYNDLTAKAIDNIKMMEQIDIRNLITYTENSQKMKIVNYTEVGDLGYDSEVFIDEESSDFLIYISAIGKYIKIDTSANQMSEMNSPVEYSKFIDEELIEEVVSTWRAIVDEENVFIGEDTIVDTKEGKVKATRYNIQLDEDKLSLLSEKINGIISNHLEEVELQSFEITTLEYTALEDRDGYLVKEEVTLGIAIDEKEVPLKQVIVEFDTINYDIEQDQEIEMPVVTEQDLMNVDELDQSFDK